MIIIEISDQIYLMQTYLVSGLDMGDFSRTHLRPKPNWLRERKRERERERERVVEKEEKESAKGDLQVNMSVIASTL